MEIGLSVYLTITASFMVFIAVALCIVWPHVLPGMYGKVRAAAVTMYLYRTWWIFVRP